MKKNAGFMYGPDGAVCNPFIGDSYLFMNNSVNDTNNFGQNEAREGYSTKGQYRVSLPDGRVQVNQSHF